MMCQNCPEIGGVVCESNTPETFCSPHNGFEGRGTHQDPSDSIPKPRPFKETNRDYNNFQPNVQIATKNTFGLLRHTVEIQA